jgi:hypothetical protein
LFEWNRIFDFSNNGKVKISNLESVLKTALNKLEKLSKIWGSGELEDK